MKVENALAGTLHNYADNWRGHSAARIVGRTTEEAMGEQRTPQARGETRNH